MVLELKRKSLVPRVLDGKIDEPLELTVEEASCERPRLKEVNDDLRRSVEEAGLLVHKAEIGETVTSLGMTLHSDPPGMAPVEEKFWVLYEATLYLAGPETREIDSRIIETTIANWTWFFLLLRPGFSILDRSYEFCRIHREGAQPVLLWEVVKDELGACAGIGLLVEVDFSLPWCLWAYMCDSSPFGYAVIRARSSVEELRSEAILAAYGGWGLEADRSLEEEIHGQEPGIAEAIKRLPAVPLPRQLRIFRIAVFFCGPRSEGDLEDALTSSLAKLGAVGLTENFDISEGGDSMDFTRPAVQERELERVKSGQYGLIVLRLPAVTWDSCSRRCSIDAWDSCSRRFGGQGPTRRAARQLTSQNRIALFSLKAVVAALRSRSLFLLFQSSPALISGTSASKGIFWGLPETKEVTSLEGVSTVTMSGEKWGLAPQQRFFGIATVPELLRRVRKVPKEEQLHEAALRGRPAQCLPSLFSQTLGGALGRALADSVLHGDLVDLGKQLQHRMALSTLTDMRAKEIRKARAPPIGASWDSLKRWQVCVCGRWSFEEHNNIGEIRSVVACLKHPARSFSNWNSRLLVITDSLVALGVLAKGRSLSRGLLRQARVAAAYQIGLDIRLVLRFCPSGRNHADGPSRRQKLGVARKKVFQRVRVPGWV